MSISVSEILLTPTRESASAWAEDLIGEEFMVVLVSVGFLGHGLKWEPAGVENTSCEYVEVAVSG